MIARCRTCPNVVTATSGSCADCDRRALYGVIVETLVGDHEVITGARLTEDPPFLRALDAVAELMITGARVRRAHRKELNETIRDAGRDANAAFREGVAEGRSSEGRGGLW